MFDSKELAAKFPQTQNGLVYLDSAATSLKYGPMLKKIYDFESFAVANVHRGAHRLSAEATGLYEKSRTEVAEYLNVRESEIIFTTGTTDALNTLAQSFSDKFVEGDVIVLSEMEHHANLLPWQRLATQKKVILKFMSVDEKGELNLDDLKKFIQEGNVKLVSLCHVSNTLGTVNPIKKLSKLCKEKGILFGLDGAQSVTFQKVDLKDLDVDFFCFSAHKIFGPFGLGVLYVREELLKTLQPARLGGGIITEVEYQKHGLLEGPVRFEPGTPNISAVAFFAEVIEFLKDLDFTRIHEYEKSLLNKAQKGLNSLGGYQEFGVSESKVNILSFNFEGVHPNDLCELLDQQGVALRSGHHCTQPLFKKFNLSGSARASFSFYNTESDVEKFVEASRKALEMLR